MPLERLSKILAKRGIASRRHAEKIILDKRVNINGKLAQKPEDKADPEKDIITLDGKVLAKQEEKKVYFVLNKPKGYLCTNEKKGKTKIVCDLFSSIPCRLFTVGRLDKDTTGLILVTNDGNFTQKVIHPSNELTKEYLVRVRQELSHEELFALSEGAFVEGVWIKPISVKKVRRGTCKIVIAEGKKHEIRELILAAHLFLLELKRIRIGSLLLGELAEGSYRPLLESEKKQLLFPKS